jgi:hypothetical protein
MAYGLGVVVSDFNGDGRPDIYVSNDFFERDYLYINNWNGTFTDVIEKAVPVISYFSMGLDAADVDNDGWPDLYTTDMLPEDDVRLKTTTQFEDWGLYQTRVKNGYHHQALRNMLQRNNQNGTFSDVGQLAGVARTDWSWSALIADFDLDGRKDIFVTNGIAKDLTNQDYVQHLADPRTMQEATNNGKSKVDFSKLIAGMTSTPLSNYAFQSTGGLRFVNEAKPWGLDTPSFSSGAAYGDLDGDGAPDLVVNNIDQEAEQRARPASGEPFPPRPPRRQRGEPLRCRRTRHPVRGYRSLHAGAVAGARLPVERGLRARLRARRARQGGFAARAVAGREGEPAGEHRDERADHRRGVRRHGARPRAPAGASAAVRRDDGRGDRLRAPRERVRRLRSRAAHPEASLDGGARARRGRRGWRWAR